MEEAGSTCGATIVHAMWQDALESGSVISTDATLALIQPEKSQNGQRQACKKGHFFTAVVDTDHVLFAYAEKHTQDFVRKLFGGFTGFLQSDASNVYDILDRGPPSEDDETVTLVGCWAHCRRYFFEAAICKHQTGIQGLLRIRAIYAADDAFRKLPPAKRKALRDTHLRPLMLSFFEWVKATRLTTPGRSLATKALGYAFNQENELLRVLDDGRLPLDNTRSERSLRKIVVGRKNWMFYGSDTHAESAAAIFSLIASCRLHRLDAEQYLDEILRVLPYWPRLATSSSLRSSGPPPVPSFAPRNSTHRCARSPSRRRPELGASAASRPPAELPFQDGVGVAVTIFCQASSVAFADAIAQTNASTSWPKLMSPYKVDARPSESGGRQKAQSITGMRSTSAQPPRMNAATIGSIQDPTTGPATNAGSTVPALAFT